MIAASHCFSLIQVIAGKCIARTSCIRICKSNEVKSIPLSKPKREQGNTLSSSNKNFIDSVGAIMPNSCDPKLRYKVTGYFDADSRTIFFDME